MVGGWVVGLVTVLYVVGLKIAIFLGWGNDGQKFIDKKNYRYQKSKSQKSL